jgi:adenine-specific DNA-methyltransferase
MTTTKKPALPTPIDTITHHETRVNIPTEELRDFVPDDEGTAAATLLYPRDPSLDPQLVWKGKDAQDAEDLAVPVVPVYIQEKIHPKAIIENLRAEAAGTVPQQASLFADFDGIAFEEMVEFYQHEQHWANRLILGDALLVMTSLAEKEGLKGKVQTIYMDPPYGIKFGSNWQVSTRKRDVKDGKAEDATRQPEQIRAFRDTWALGIHSYLAYLRDRLTAARDLLTESGSIFVQIGDENVHLVRSVMDEVFGSENFISLISFRTTSSLGGMYLGKSCDYVLFYGKSASQLKYRQLYKSRGIEDDVGARFTRLEMPDGTRRTLTSQERTDTGEIPKDARVYRHDNLTSQSGTDKSRFPVAFNGSSFTPGTGYWKTNQLGMNQLANAHRLAAPTQNSLTYIRFIDDFPLSSFSNVWTDTQTGGSSPRSSVKASTRVCQPTRVISASC